MVRFHPPPPEFMTTRNACRFYIYYLRIYTTLYSVPELSEILRDVQIDFSTNYRNGGIEACRAMVINLARKVAEINASTDANQEIAGETIANQNELSAQTVLVRMELLEGSMRNYITAVSRHSFALFLLHGLEKHLANKPSLPPPSA